MKPFQTLLRTNSKRYMASSTKYLNERIKPGESTQVFTGFILL